MLVLGVQSSDSVLHTHIFILFHILFAYSKTILLMCDWQEDNFFLSLFEPCCLIISGGSFFSFVSFPLTQAFITQLKTQRGPSVGSPVLSVPFPSVKETPGFIYLPLPHCSREYFFLISQWLLSLAAQPSLSWNVLFQVFCPGSVSCARPVPFTPVWLEAKDQTL